MTVYAATLHDSYPDENGVETPYEDKIIAVQNKDEFKCTSLPDLDMTFKMLNEEFFKKCTDIQLVFDN